MNYRDPLNSISHAVHHALLVLPRDLGWWPAGLRASDLDIYCFGQGWPSTTLGFGGAGGQTMCEADTVVLVAATGHAAVYVGGRLAHAVERPNDRFREDLARRRMAGKAEGVDYEAGRP